jgi:hypothetical protein
MLVAVQEMTLGIENQDTKAILKRYEDMRAKAKELTEVIEQEEGEVLKGHLERLRELLGSYIGECEEHERELTMVRVDELAPTMVFLDETRSKYAGMGNMSIMQKSCSGKSKASRKA